MYEALEEIATIVISLVGVVTIGERLVRFANWVLTIRGRGRHRVL